MHRATFHHPSFRHIEDIKFSPNGVSALLISHTSRMFLIFSLKKGKVVATYQSQFPILNPQFDKQSQNVLFGQGKLVQIYSLKYGRIVEGIQGGDTAEKGKQQGEENKQDVKFVLEQANCGKVLIFDSERIYEMKEDEEEGEEGEAEIHEKAKEN